MRYYILIKRKGSKSWLGAIPAKKGVTKPKLQKIVYKGIKSGYSYKIITEATLKRYIRSIAKTRRRRKTTYRRKRR